MKKLFSSLIISIALGLTMTSVMADNVTDAKAFFNNYVEAANSYSANIPNF